MNRGAAEILEEKDLTGEALWAKVQGILADPDRLRSLGAVSYTHLDSTFTCGGGIIVEGYPDPISCWKTSGHGLETFREGLYLSLIHI